MEFFRVSILGRRIGRLKDSGIMRDVPLSLSACYTSEFSRGGEGILFNYGIRMVAEDRMKIEV